MKKILLILILTGVLYVLTTIILEQVQILKSDTTEIKPGNKVAF